MYRTTVKCKEQGAFSTKKDKTLFLNYGSIVSVFDTYVLFYNYEIRELQNAEASEKTHLDFF